MSQICNSLSLVENSAVLQKFPIIENSNNREYNFIQDVKTLMIKVNINNTLFVGI